MKNKVTIEIDLEPAKKNAEEYVKKKVREGIRDSIHDVLVEVDFPNIRFPDIEKRLEKLEDWKRDIEQGWIDLSKYCKGCKKCTKNTKK